VSIGSVDKPARQTEAVEPRRSTLSGSALSAATWRQAIETLRERTARGA
jgi:hypothetical protein